MQQNGEESAFNQQLQQDNLESASGQLQSNVIAIYVSFNPRYSAIRYGSQWTSSLNPVYESIRSNQLNAQLQQGDFTAAFVNTLNAINNAIGGGGASSGSGSTATSPSSSSSNGGSSLPWVLGAAVGGGGGW